MHAHTFMLIAVLGHKAQVLPQNRYDMLYPGSWLGHVVGNYQGWSFCHSRDIQHSLCTPFGISGKRGRESCKMKFPSVELDKRDRDEHTDSLIKSLLDEEKASKKQKRGSPQADVIAKPAVPARKGKTFAEIEAEEGGPIKESLVGMAQTKRALDRKKRDVDVGDTDVVTNTERYEKDTLDVEEEDGITFEPFNLKQEREEGYFDEAGNYVLRKQNGEDGEDEKDAWLNSDEAKVVSEEVRRKIESQRARAEEAARRGPLTERQIAQRKADMAVMMRPGETITRALKRLGGSGGSGGAAAAGLTHRAMGKRERARLQAQQQQQQQQQSAGDAGGHHAAKDAGAGAAREQFVRMTELADELLEEGELEIYDETREELLRSARMWLPHLDSAAASAAPSSSMSPLAGGAAGTGVAAKSANDASDADEDMFADDDDEDGGGGGTIAGPGKGAAVPAAAMAAVDQDQDMFSDGDEDHDTDGNGGRRDDAPAATDAAARGNGDGRAELCAPGGQTVVRAASSVTASAAQSGGGDTVDYASWPIKELKRLLQERGVDPSGFVEKGDLVSKVKEVVDASGPAGGNASGGGGGNESAFVAPPGYVYDPSSGYFFSEDSGMYYDTNTGGYCQAATGKWFYLDPSSGTLLEWKQ
ncbi:hypothetical protein Vretimale_9026 [Volvox reticuliferus]|uniref:OCRE domain-containing protein n=1 Tax=Volvox reticuliferus TaxID=1737510 RepID=A0A8J4CM96_9CHLO|nr:hypothetical protein Vretifemale_14260 [Volvox reticuliferus]GIM04458.1 hypothetical protein Vretimale_9026 [Volvox reticuliferus]